MVPDIDAYAARIQKNGAKLALSPKTQFYGLRTAVGNSPLVGEVRGRGLLVCADLVEPDGSGRPLDKDAVAKLDRKAWDRGAIVYARGNVLRLAPPLCITREEVDTLVDIAASSIRDLERETAR